MLVTGGSGLVGKAIEHVVHHSDDPRFRKRDNETWVFLTSKDGDLRSVAPAHQAALTRFRSKTRSSMVGRRGRGRSRTAATGSRPRPSLISTSPRT